MLFLLTDDMPHSDNKKRARRRAWFHDFLFYFLFLTADFFFAGARLPALRLGAAFFLAVFLTLFFVAFLALEREGFFTARFNGFFVDFLAFFIVFFAAAFGFFDTLDFLITFFFLTGFAFFGAAFFFSGFAFFFGAAFFFFAGTVFGFTTIPASFSMDTFVISTTAGTTTGGSITGALAGSGAAGTDGETAGATGRGWGGFLNRLSKALFWLGVGFSIAGNGIRTEPDFKKRQ